MKKFMHEHDTEFAFVQQHLCPKGIKIFGERGKEAAVKDLKQQHARKCFAPIAMEALSKTERDRAQQALMHLTEKRDGVMKGQMVHGGKPT